MTHYGTLLKECGFGSIRRGVVVTRRSLFMTDTLGHPFLPKRKCYILNKNVLFFPNSCVINSMFNGEIQDKSANNLDLGNIKVDWLKWLH